MDSIIYCGTRIGFKHFSRNNGRWFGFAELAKYNSAFAEVELFMIPGLHDGFTTREEARSHIFEMAKDHLDERRSK
jgi:hypothetical protein